MIIVTLVATLAAGMVWQQYRAVQIEAADRARAQSGWILQGALDWARLILREDDPKVDHLGEVWAVPLAEARLSTFLAADRSSSTDDGPEAFLSGTIADAQSRYNLRNLLGDAKAREGEQRVLERLCDTAGVPGGTAAAITKNLRDAFGTPATPSLGNGTPGADGKPTGGQPPPVAPTPGAPNPNGGANPGAGATPAIPANGALQPANLDQLVWFGISREVIERLRPFVTLLPRGTPVNLNTASREVIAALFDGVDLASAERLVQARQSRPLQALDDAKNYFPPTVVLDAQRGAVQTSYFLVTGRLRLDERQLEQRSLVERRGRDIAVLARERASALIEIKR